MPRSLNPITIQERLPIIRSIQADLDVRLQNPNFENKCIFRIAENTLGDKYGFSALAQALAIICGWIEETGIKTGKGQDSYCFVKTNDAGQWSRMYELIEENVSAHNQSETRTSSSKTAGEAESVVKLPKGTMWEDLELRFNNEHTITVVLKGEIHNCYDYADLGFAMENTKDKKPNKAWKFLYQLAIIQRYKHVTPPIKSLFITPLETTLAGCDQIKRDLLKGLQDAFGVLGDPFEKYDSDMGYTTKFKLMPEPGFRGTGELHPSGGALYDEKTSDVFLGINDIP